jgi:hypothetical protein
MTRAPRNDPLLAGDSEQGIFSGGSRRLSTNRRSSSNASTVGCFGHFLIMLLPLMACGMVLALLGLLIFNFEGEDSIQTTMVSNALEEYQPYSEIVLFASLAAVFTFAVTAARSIQIAVSLQRTKSSSNSNISDWKQQTSAYTFCLRFLNGTAALINTVAYIGFILLVAFQVNQEEPPYAQLLHVIGAFVFFGGVSFYHVIHAYLLYQQDQQKYPRWLKWMFIGLTLCIVISVVVFALNFQAMEALEFEWAAVFFVAITVGCFSILFHIDNVDDEVQTFFGRCCCCCGWCCRRNR